MQQSKHIVFQPLNTINTVRQSNLVRSMDLILDRHPAYTKIAQKLGLTRRDFHEVNNLDVLPVTTKLDFIKKPDAYTLNTQGLTPEEVAVWDVMNTTGTTAGAPTPFLSTTYDFYRILSVQEGMLRLRGVGHTDKVANLFPLTVWPHGAYTRVAHAAATLKIPVTNILPGNPSRSFKHGSTLEQAITIIEKDLPTILWGVPSYLRRLLSRAGELGADFSTVRFAFITGESTPEILRNDLITKLLALGASNPFVSISYGSTEMQGGMVECTPGSGYHNPAPDQFHIDVVDPQTHSPLPAGKSGLVLLSHIDRRGTVLLRYSLGDISKLASGPCPYCGSHTQRLVETPTRIDSLIKIKGTLVNPAIIEEILLLDPTIKEFQIVVEHENKDDALSPDQLRLRVSGSPINLVQKVKVATGIRPVVEITEVEEIFIPGETLKNQRVIDTRKNRKGDPIGPPY